MKKNEVEKIYDCGFNDSWEMTKVIATMSEKDWEAVIGSAEAYRLSGTEVAKRLMLEAPKIEEKNEKEKEKPVMGDEVMYASFHCIVTHTENGKADMLSLDGKTFTGIPLPCLKRTGKHVHLIKLLLDSIRETLEEGQG